MEWSNLNDEVNNYNFFKWKWAQYSISWAWIEFLLQTFKFQMNMKLTFDIVQTVLKRGIFDLPNENNNFRSKENEEI